MAPNMRARVQAVVLLALVATTGAVAGVVGDRLLRDRGAAPVADAGMRAFPSPVGGPWRWEPQPDARYSERLAESLSLTPDQESTIDLIVAEEQVRVHELTYELQPHFRAIAEETRGRIENVLTPEQRQQLRTLREERMRGRGMGPGAAMRGIGRDVRDSAMLHVRDSMRERRDSIMRERRNSIMRERNGLIRERRDSVIRQLRRLPPEVRDSVIMELRGTLPAQRDSMMRLRQQRLRTLPDSILR
jgi:Spy/CpxP family protein refolding chaperone